MTTPVEQLSYKATNVGIYNSGVTAPTPRNLGDVAGDIIDVRRFGAKGDGSTNDQPAVQAAVNWQTSNGNRGVIFFPAGVYVFNSAVTYNDDAQHSLIFRGVGRGSRIQGSFAGFLFDRGGVGGEASGQQNIDVFEYLWLLNTSNNPTAGCIRWNSCNELTVRECQISGYTGISSSDNSFMFRVVNCILPNAGFDNFTVYPSVGQGALPGTVGILGNPQLISGCWIVGYGEGIRAQQGGTIIGSHLEVCLIGINIGAFPDGSAPYANGGECVINTGFEACDTGLQINQCGSGSFMSMGHTSSGANTGSTVLLRGITNATWAATAGGTATITTKDILPLGSGFLGRITATTLGIGATQGFFHNVTPTSVVHGLPLATGTFIIASSVLTANTSISSGPTAGAGFTASISGTTLTTSPSVTTLTVGAYVFSNAPGVFIGDGSIDPNTVITANLGGGQYTVSVSQTVASQAMLTGTTWQVNNSQTAASQQMYALYPQLGFSVEGVLPTGFNTSAVVGTVTGTNTVTIPLSNPGSSYPRTANSITNMVYSAGTMTVTTTDTLPAGTFRIVDITGVNPSQFNLFAAYVIATQQTAHTFTYASGDPGVTYTSGGSYTMGSYGNCCNEAHKIANAAWCMFDGLGSSGSYLNAAININGSAPRSNFLNCVPFNGFAGKPAWILPSIRTDIQCINCNNPTLADIFNNLPGQAGQPNITTAIEGMQYGISDCPGTSDTTIAAVGSSYSAGTVSLATVGAHGIAVGGLFDISGATGTGADLAKINGEFIAIAGTTGTTLKYTIASGLTITTITGGNVQTPPTIGAPISVGGGQWHVLARWNGTTWTVMGI